MCIYMYVVHIRMYMLAWKTLIVASPVNPLGYVAATFRRAGGSAASGASHDVATPPPGSPLQTASPRLADRRGPSHGPLPRRAVHIVHVAAVEFVGPSLVRLFRNGLMWPLSALLVLDALQIDKIGRVSGCRDGDVEPTLSGRPYPL